MVNAKIRVNVNGFGATAEYAEALLAKATERGDYGEAGISLYGKFGNGDIIDVTKLSTGDYYIKPIYMTDPKDTFNFLVEIRKAVEA